MSWRLRVGLPWGGGSFVPQPVLSRAKSLISQDLAPLEGAGERKPETRGGCENLHASGWAFLAPQSVTYPAVKPKREILLIGAMARVRTSRQVLVVLTACTGRSARATEAQRCCAP